MELMDQATIRVVENHLRIGLPVEAEALGVKVVEICGKLHEQGRELPAALMQTLPHITSPEMIADIVTQAFVRGPMRQQRLMEEASVSARMRLLIRYLQPEIA